MTTEPIINTVIDVESLAASMGRRVMSDQLRLTPQCCIFRTPAILSRHKKEAYVPGYFCFGPFHHFDPNLQASEGIKLKYLGELLDRSSDGNSDAMLKECLNSIDQVKEEARDCYAENLNHISDEEFVQMLVVDGCFIIEFLRKLNGVVSWNVEDDPVFSMSCMAGFLLHDLTLLENQIPWLVLDVLFQITKHPSETQSLVELALKLFKAKFSVDLGVDNILIDLALFVDVKIKHIIHLIWLSLVLPSENRDEGEKWFSIPSATQLIEAGVTFVGAEKSKSMLDIKYRSGGVVEIPQLMIDETTDTIFRNLISYEQCLPNCKAPFTCYAKILDDLIETQDDMEILCRKKVFVNWLSPEDATQVFKKLQFDTAVNQSYYYRLCKDIRQHCDRGWPRWRAALVQNYFTKPWAVVAIIYATIMLVLTLLQIVLK